QFILRGGHQEKILLKSLLLSTLLLTFGSTILPTGIVFASEQNIIKNTSYSNDDNLNVSIEKTRTVVLW
ncbi:TPA: hypothetical protein ACH6J7_001427, partial [Enterococcus faecium]